MTDVSHQQGRAATTTTSHEDTHTFGSRTQSKHIRTFKKNSKQKPLGLTCFATLGSIAGAAPSRIFVVKRVKEL